MCILISVHLSEKIPNNGAAEISWQKTLITGISAHNAGQLIGSINWAQTNIVMESMAGCNLRLFRVKLITYHMTPPPLIHRHSHTHIWWPQHVVMRCPRHRPPHRFIRVRARILFWTRISLCSRVNALKFKQSSLQSLGRGQT